MPAGSGYLREIALDSSSIELNGSEIESVVVEGDRVRVRFSRAYIVKTMTGSAERTRWWQAGDMVMEGAEVTGELPQMPAVCAGGDVFDNVYTYRDMVPLPLDTRGRTGCRLSVAGSDLVVDVSAETLHLDMLETPKYIEHLRPE